MHLLAGRNASLIPVMIAVAIVLVAGVASPSADFDPDPGTQSDDIPLVKDEYEAKVDDTHQKTSELLLSAAEWLDSFFDDERYTAEENATRAKLRLSFGYSRFDRFDFSPRVRLRLKLPRLSKKAFLIVGASDDDDFDTDDTPISNNPNNEDSERNDLSAGLRYFLDVGKDYHISTTFGLSWGYMYAGLRYRHEHDFGPWQGRATNNLRYYTDDGWENKFGLDMERHFSRRWFFRTSGSIDWFESQNGLPHSLGVSLYQVLNQHQALRYECGSYFNTRPSYKMTDLQFKVRYRQRFYRDWLILEVAPQIGFPYAHNREPNPGIVLRLEADFGYMAEQDVFRAVFGF